MEKIQGIEDLIVYLESVGYPLSKRQIDEFLTARKIPHSKPYGNMLVFERSHIEWWVNMQKKNES